MIDLSQTIAQIQESLASETDAEVFADLLIQERKGKKRKVMKRWLRERMKALAFPPSNYDPKFKMFEKRPKDPITGIPIIG